MIYVVTTHEDVDIAQNGNKVSEGIDVSIKARKGFFSLQVEIESGSTSTSVTITYSISNDAINFVTGDTAIVSAIDISSGLDTIYSFEPKLCKWIKITVTENNTGTVVDCTCTLAIQ